MANKSINKRQKVVTWVAGALLLAGYIFSRSQQIPHGRFLLIFYLPVFVIAIVLFIRFESKEK